MIVSNLPATPASLECCICSKPLAGTGLDKSALMFDQHGQPRGWAHPHHAIDLPRYIRRSIEKARCARCGLPLLNEHGIGTRGPGAWCRDLGPFVCADDGDLGADGEIDRTKHSTAIVEIPDVHNPLERAA